MTAKMKGKPYRSHSRADWDVVRVRIMRWCLRVKLAQNWETFSRLLLATGDRPIVEDSRKDNFWGAIPFNEETLTGANVLGHLLMELREILKKPDVDTLISVSPPPIPNFLLYGQEIGVIRNLDNYLSHNINFPKTNIQVSLVSESVNYEKNKPIVELSQLNDDSEAVTIQVDNSIPAINEKFTNETKDYDVFYIVLPYIEELLTTARGEKEIADIMKVGLKQMREWLKRAVEIEKIKKLYKPVRYVTLSQQKYEQLSLLNQKN